MTSLISLSNYYTQLNVYCTTRDSCLRNFYIMTLPGMLWTHPYFLINVLLVGNGSFFLIMAKAFGEHCFTSIANLKSALPYSLAWDLSFSLQKISICSLEKRFLSLCLITASAAFLGKCPLMTLSYFSWYMHNFLFRVAIWLFRSLITWSYFTCSDFKLWISIKRLLTRGFELPP